MFFWFDWAHITVFFGTNPWKMDLKKLVKIKFPLRQGIPVFFKHFSSGLKLGILALWHDSAFLLVFIKKENFCPVEEKTLTSGVGLPASSKEPGTEWPGRTNDHSQQKFKEQYSEDKNILDLLVHSRIRHVAYSSFEGKSSARRRILE